MHFISSKGKILEILSSIPYWIIPTWPPILQWITMCSKMRMELIILSEQDIFTWALSSMKHQVRCLKIYFLKKLLKILYLQITLDHSQMIMMNICKSFSKILNLSQSSTKWEISSLRKYPPQLIAIYGAWYNGSISNQEVSSK